MEIGFITPAASIHEGEASLFISKSSHSRNTASVVFKFYKHKSMYNDSKCSVAHKKLQTVTVKLIN